MTSGRYVPVTVNLLASHRARLDAEARAQDVTRSHVVRSAVRAYLAFREREDDRAVSEVSRDDPALGQVPMGTPMRE